jgi:hypothetical protein
MNNFPLGETFLLSRLFMVSEEECSRALVELFMLKCLQVHHIIDFILSLLNILVIRERTFNCFFWTNITSWIFWRNLFLSLQHFDKKFDCWNNCGQWNIGAANLFCINVLGRFEKRFTLAQTVWSFSVL